MARRHRDWRHKRSKFFGCQILRAEILLRTNVRRVCLRHPRRLWRRHCLSAQASAAARRVKRDPPLIKAVKQAATCLSSSARQSAKSTHLAQLSLGPLALLTTGMTADVRSFRAACAITPARVR